MALLIPDISLLRFLLLNKHASQKKHFSSKRELVVATKCDMLHNDTLVNLDSLYFKVMSRIGDHVPVVGTSARFGLGINRLVHVVRQMLFPEALVLMRPRAQAEIIHPHQLENFS